jgi:hypothetical protein
VARKPTVDRKPSDLETLFLFQVRAIGLPEPVLNYLFHEDRRWEFDFAWPDKMLSVELQGGTWNQGAHGRGSGILRDIQKLNAATLRGWRVILATTDMVSSGEALRDLEAMLVKGNKEAS